MAKRVIRVELSRNLEQFQRKMLEAERLLADRDKPQSGT